MLYTSGEMEQQAVLNTAAKLCAAARTAPKAHGKDTIRTLVLTGEDKNRVADNMEEIGTRELGAEKMPAWFGRDADNVRRSQALVLIGAEKTYRGVGVCGFCGFGNCAGCKAAGGNCGFAYVDLGIAVGSAVAEAAIDMVDNRIMYSAGKAAEELYDSNVLWMGVPLSVSGKSIFFDRKPKT